MSEFFHMGGYAIFVWSSYAVTALGLIGLAVATLIALKGAEKDLKDMEAIAPRRRRRRANPTETTENAHAEP